MTEWPARKPRRRYQGKLTDNDIWDRFEIRPDDIFVCTPPKCGTTWTQTLLRMLVAGEAHPRVYDNRVSPWIDVGFRDREEQAEVLKAQTHRRVIKTHTPLDGIAYDPRATYLAVFRHPIDMHLSFRTHAENMKEPWLEDMFPPDEREGFRRFVSHDWTEGGTDDLNLTSTVHFFRGYADATAAGNVHLFHYADLTRDLPGQVTRMADLLGIEIDDAFRDAVVKAGQFASLKSHAEELAKKPGPGSVFKDPAKFYAEGTSGKWHGRLTDTDLDAYHTALGTMVTPAEKTWLETGGPFSR